MIHKVSLAFLDSDSDAELIVSTNRIVTKMTGNTNYPTPKPTLAQVGAANTAFGTALELAAKGDTDLVTAKNADRVTLTALLRTLAAYVQANCQNDLVILLSSGFLAQKQASAPSQLPAPTNLRLRRPELSGQLKGRVDPVANARTYQWRRAPASAPTDWTTTETSAASVTLEDLTPGTMYVVQCRAFGALGWSEWSDPAMMMAV